MLFSCLEIMLRKMRESAKISAEKSHHCKYRAEQAGQFGSFFPAPSQVRKRLRQRPCIALLDIFQTAFEACIKFKSCGDLFISLDTHDGKIPFAVFGNEYRLSVSVAQSRNAVVVISQVCIGFDNRYNAPPLIYSIIRYFSNEIKIDATSF